MEEGHCIIEKLSLLCSLESARAIDAIPTSLSHLETYRQWTDRRIALAKTGQNPLLPNVSELFKLSSNQRQAMIEDIMSRSRGQRISAPADAIYVVYSSITGLYSGKIDVLEALLRDNVLTRLYDFLNADCADFISLLGHSKPNLKILEIGAGTGGLTELVLQALETPSSSPFDERLYSKYTYTDISAGFFVAAQERFAAFPGLEYTMLDISQDPVSQGFQAGSYDLIIASNVLHATPNLRATLRHCHTLLHPHGRLLLQELCSESKWINYVMGVLPGWWLGAADGRADEPYLIGSERWDRELRGAGFAGVDTFCPDQRSPYQFNAHIVARPAAAAPSTTSASRRVCLLVGVHSEIEKISISSTASQIKALFVAQGYDVQLCTLDQDPPSGVDIVSLLDLTQPFLHAITAQDLALFVQFVAGLAERSSGLLWVTQAAQVACRDPRYALIIGMARTIRSEHGAAFATLEVDDLAHPAAWSSLVVPVFRKFQRSLELELVDVETDLDPDYEYAIANGLVCIPRLHWINVPRELVRKTDVTSKGLWIGRPGLLQSLEWRPHATTTTELAAADVEIDVRAGGLNFKVCG
jgi:SAM-dependent methyltransferase